MAAASARRRPAPLVLLSTVFLILWLLAAAFPFLWTAWGSFKVELDFFSITDWTNALTGEATENTYGRPFTGAGYFGA